MTGLRQFLWRVRALFKRNTLDAEFRNEIQSHLEMLAARIDPTHVYITSRTGRGALLLRSLAGNRVLPAIQKVIGLENDDLARSLTLRSVEEFASVQRFISQALTGVGGIIGAISLLLAGAGIYGVMAYLVTRRTREIGVRISLGATWRDIIREIILYGFRPIFAGMAAGVIFAGIAALLFRLSLSSPGAYDVLYGVSFYDPVSFIGVSAFVLAIAVLASLVPAARAVRIDPIIALRHE